MRTRLVTGAVLTAAVALAGAALAAPSVQISSLDVSGDTVTLTGSASFDGPGDGALGGTVTTTAPSRAPFTAAGVELKSARIDPLPDGSGLKFTWQMTGMPAQPPAEVVRYTWSFGIGEKTFQLQAKRSNAASTTALDDPAGHAGTVATTAFQLRGNCTPNFMGSPAPVASCPHLQFLKGAFDVAKAQVTMDLPFGTQGITKGALLVPVQTATMSIGAGFQAAVSNTNTTTYINDWASYYSGPAVEVGTGFAGEDPSSALFTPATLTGSSFVGSAPVEFDADVAVARACEGTTCTYATQSLK